MEQSVYMAGLDRRDAFTKQPIHYILVDLSTPPDMTYFQNVFLALKSIITLATMMKGVERIPSLGMGILTATVFKSMTPVDTTNGAYGQLIEALMQVKKHVSENQCPVTKNARQNYETSIIIAMHEAASQYSQFIKDKVSQQLQVTMITFSFDERALKCMNQALTELGTDKLKKIQILVIGEENATTDGTSQSDVHKHGNSDWDDITETVIIDGSQREIDKFFKSWLHDCVTDREHLCLYFPTYQFSIKCDIQEHLIDMKKFPFAQHFNMCTDPTCLQTVVRNQNKDTSKQLPVHHLEMCGLVKISGICDSIIYGFPVLIQPTACWRLEWSELELNQQYFNTLRECLLDRQQAIIIKNRGVGKRPVNDLQHYFAMLPGPKETMMLKNLATAEQLLPTTSSRLEEFKPSKEVLREVQASLQNLPVSDTYNPLMFSSGLHNCIFDSLYNDDLVKRTVRGQKSSKNSFHNIKQKAKEKQKSLACKGDAFHEFE